jgi:dihydrofolate synthase/folylpolyglutamate synthase
VRPGIEGRAMLHNAALAVAACAAAGALPDPVAALRGIEEARLPGRMERRTGLGRRWVLDGAHNEDAARHLCASVAAPAVAVVGMLEGHDSRAFARALVPAVDRAFAVPVDWHRGRDPGQLAAEFTEAGLGCQACPSLEAGLEAAASEPCQTLLVTGSFYLVGEAGRLLDPEA